MMKSLKRGIALFLALVFVLTLMPAAALAAETPAKFEVVVSSVADGKVAEVRGTVDANYQAELTIPNQKVDASNVTVAVSMTDVASLGVAGTRSYQRTLKTGIEAGKYTMTPFEVLAIVAESADKEALRDFDQTVINATITSGGESKAVQYTVKGEAFSETDGKTIKATADTADARAAWQLMTAGNFAATTQTKDDSYFTVKNGSWLQIGDEKLVFEKEGDLKLDNLGDPALVGTIKDMVAVTDTKSNALRFHLAAGTTLAMGQSVAALTKDLDVEVTGLTNLPENILSDLRESVNGTTDAKNLLVTLVVALEKAVALVDGETINVNMTFTEPKTPKFEVVVSSKLAKGGITEVTGEVYDDYSAKLVLPNAEVSASNVTVKVAMTNVDSLGVTGTRQHSMTLNTGVNSQGNLPEALSTLFGENGGLDPLFGFNGATVKANIIVNGETKSVTYTLTGSEFDLKTSDEKVITADVDEAAARAAWQHMINGNIVNGTKEDDSYIVIANGSSLQIGTEKLVFEENYSGDLKVDNLGNANGNVQNIKDAVKIVPAEQSALAFELKAGTTLAVGSSYAKLAKDAKVTVSGLTKDIPDDILSGLREAVNDPNADGKEIIILLLTAMEKAVALVDGETVTVDVEFVYPWTVSFDTGIEDVEIESQTVNGGQTAAKPELPEAMVKTGYAFGGWMLGDEEYDFDTVVTEDVALTAKWSPITYTVNGVEFTYDVPGTLEEPTREGWEFQGWAEKDGGELVYAPDAELVNLASEQDAEVTLYPVWGNHRHNFQLVEGSWSWGADNRSASAQFTCDLCDYTAENPYTQIAAVTSRVTRSPSCSEEGERVYTATALTATDTRTVAISKLPHTSEDMAPVAATCTTAGRTGGKLCAVCGEELEAPETVPALGHRWDAGVVTTEPTYDAAGVRTYTCLNDSTHTFTESIPALVRPVGPSGPSGGGTTTITDPSVPLAGVLPFDDVAESDWYYNAVKFVYEKDLMAGVDDNTFDPYMDTTRGMIVTILYRLEGSPAVTGTSKFADVVSGAYYHDAVVWGTANGIVSGYDETSYGPADTITREQFAAILLRYANYKKYDVKVADGATLDFTDADQVSEYAKSAVLWAVEKELIHGMGDGTVSPNTGATRAQAATILMGFCEKIAK